MSPRRRRSLRSNAGAGFRVAQGSIDADHARRIGKRGAGQAEVAGLLIARLLRIWIGRAGVLIWIFEVRVDRVGHLADERIRETGRDNGYRDAPACESGGEHPLRAWHQKARQRVGGVTGSVGAARALRAVPSLIVAVARGRRASGSTMNE